MKGVSYSHEMEIMRRIAAQAGELLLHYAGQGLKAEEKSDESPVTIADKESEQLIVKALTTAFPDDGLLGEEGTNKPSKNGRKWIIDPLDGTRDFVRGNGLWAVLMALEVNGDVKAGICHFPFLRRTYTAVKGSGAFCNDLPIKVSKTTDLSKAVLCANSLQKANQYPWGKDLVEWMGQFWAVRSRGGGPDCMMLISGQSDAWLEPTSQPWDLAPLKILIEEAGGKFFNMDGGSSIYAGNCLACTPALEPEMRRFFVR